MSTAPVGRRDQRVRTRVLEDNWWVILLFLVLPGLVGLWHSAVVLAGPAEWADLRSTLLGLRLAEFAPVTGIPAADQPTSPARAYATFAGILVALLVVVSALVAVAQTARSRRPGKGFASRREARTAFGEQTLRARTRRLRGSKAAQRPADEIGFPLGQVDFGLSSETIYLGQEQHLMVLAPTGAGKSYRLTSRAALTAPGALVTTSTRPDVLDVIAEQREDKGRIWVFDLLGLVGWPEQMTWNVIAGCEQTKVARGRATMIMASSAGQQQHETGNSKFFRDQARDVLAAFLHAAAVGDKTIVDVLLWSMEFESAQEPRRILREAAAADQLMLQKLLSTANGATDTVSSVRSTLDNGLSALAVGDIARGFTPRDEAVAFDPDAFARSTDTLVIIGDDQDPTDVSPLSAMLLDEVIQALKRYSRTQPDGRLNPPARLVLDEVANIAPLPKLPTQLSDLRGFGVQAIFALQSQAQAIARWNKEGERQLRSNSSAILALGGINDATTLEELSKLADKVDVAETSSSHDREGYGRNATRTVHERQVIRASEIRGLPEGVGLVIAGSTRPLLVRLPGWTDIPQGQELQKAQRRTAERRATALTTDAA